jgi:hypothetical protein
MILNINLRLLLQISGIGSSKVQLDPLKIKVVVDHAGLLALLVIFKVSIIWEINLPPYRLFLNSNSLIVIRLMKAVLADGLIRLSTGLLKMED